METRDLTAKHIKADWRSNRRLRVLLPNVSKDVAMAHLLLGQPRSMVVRSRRGPRGGFLNPQYVLYGDRPPTNDFRWQWFIVLGMVKDEEED